MRNHHRSLRTSALQRPVVPGLHVQTGVRAGVDPSGELLEATRHFLQSLLNALPTTADTTATAAPVASPTTTPATS